MFRFLWQYSTNILKGLQPILFVAYNIQISKLLLL